MTQFDQWMLNSYRARPIDLALFRIGYCLVIGLVYIPRGVWLADVPPALFSPPIGPAAFLHGFPAPGLITALNATAGLALAALLLGFATPVASVLLAILLMALDTFWNSTGKIDHTIMLVVIPAVMAFSGWGRALSVDGRSSKNGSALDLQSCWPLALLAAVIGVGMFTSAWYKASTGWLNLDTQAVYSHMVRSPVQAEREAFLHGALVDRGSTFLWEVQDYAAILLEAAILICVPWRRAFLTVIALATFFHLGVWLSFGITHYYNVVAYGAFVPWGRFAFRTQVGPGALRLPLALLAFGIASVFVTAGFLRQPIAESLRLPVKETVHCVGVAVALMYFARMALASRLSSGHPVLFFDGVCGLCNSTIAWLHARDPKQILRFAPLQGDTASHMIPEDTTSLGSMVLVDEGGTYRRSAAVVRTLRYLGGKYQVLAALLWLVPLPLRDVGYRAVAASRYRVFGQLDSCRIPTPEERELFLP